MPTVTYNNPDGSKTVVQQTSRGQEISRSTTPAGGSSSSSGGGGSSSPPPSSSAPVERQKGESPEEYTVRTSANPEQYFQGRKEESRARVRELNEQAAVMQSRGGYYDESQERRNIVVRTAESQQLAQSGEPSNNVHNGRTQLIENPPNQRRPVKTAENQRGLEAPGLAWAADDLAARDGKYTPINQTNNNPTGMPIAVERSIDNNGSQDLNTFQRNYAAYRREQAKKEYDESGFLGKVSQNVGTLGSAEGWKYIGASLNPKETMQDVVLQRMERYQSNKPTLTGAAGEYLLSPGGVTPLMKGINVATRGLGLITAAGAKAAGSVNAIEKGMKVTKALDTGVKVTGVGLLGYAEVSAISEKDYSTAIGLPLGIAIGLGASKISGKIKSARKSAKTSPFATAEAASTERINPATDTPSSRATRINEGIKDTMRNTERTVTPEEVFGRSTTKTVNVSKPGKPGKVTVGGRPESPVSDVAATMRNVGNTINNIIGGGRTSRVSKPAPKASEPTPAQSPAQGAGAQINRVMQNPFINRPQAPAGSRITGRATQAQRFPVIKTPTLAELVGRTRIRQQGMRQQYLEGARKPRTISEIMKATERNIFKQTGGRRPVMLRGSGLQKGGGRNPPVPRKSSFPINPDYTPVIKIPNPTMPRIPDPIVPRIKDMPDAYRKTPLEPYRGRYPEPIRERPPVRRPGSEQKTPKIKIPGVPFGGLPGFNLGLGGGYAKKANAQITTIENRMKRAIDLL